MNINPPSEQEELRQLLTNFLTEQSLETPQQEICPRCGAVMQFSTMTLWLYETDLAWNLRLPVCLCVDLQSSVSERQKVSDVKKEECYEHWN